MLEVCCSREIAAGFQGTLDSRAKVGAGFVMLVGSREIVYRYAGICISWSVDHHGLYIYVFLTKIILGFISFKAA